MIFWRQKGEIMKKWISRALFCSALFLTGCGGRKLCTLTSFQFQRHTTKKNLVENEELNVYNFQDAYYILDRIPGSLAGAEDMDRCYLVSNEVAEYIMGMASDRKQG